MTLRVHQLALDDLDDIARYIQQDNPLRAHTFVCEITKTIMSLQDMPLRAPLVAGVRRHVRRLPYGSYNIYYTLAGQTVLVYRVLHAARDLGMIVFGDEDAPL